MIQQTFVQFKSQIHNHLYLYQIKSENTSDKMSGFQRNNERENSWGILTSTTMVSDMPPSYDIATGNVTASHPRLPNPTRTEYFDSKDYEIGRLKVEIQRIHKLLQSDSNKIRNYRICLLIFIILIAILIITTVITITNSFFACRYLHVAIWMTTNSLNATSMLVSDVVDELRWWQLWDVGHQSNISVADLIYNNNHQQKEPTSLEAITITKPPT